VEWADLPGTMGGSPTALDSPGEPTSDVEGPVKSLLQIGLVWVVVSVVVLGVLSLLVYLGGSRRRDPGQPRSLTFDDAQVFPLTGRPVEREPEPEPPRVEPAITHPVSAHSGALDRLLAGVQLPCGLERLHPAGEDETICMAFVTTKSEPRLVAVAVVDELERLGMYVEPLNYTEARAWRDGFELAVTIHLEPNRVIRGRRPAFPNAAPDAVVVEFSVV
jgi:hypothetical protein